MKTINALLSCPNDVLNKFGSEIRRAIEDVNFYIEKLLDATIRLQHYLTSSFSQVGKPAQDHLDDTLIINSDICLAFYYHRLGTKTKDYESGTDEEINLMRNAGKHVSLFRIFDSKDDNESEKRLVDYFEKISDKAMYREIVGKEKVFEAVKTDIINYLVHSFSVELICMDRPFNPSGFFKQTIRLDKQKSEIESLIETINSLTKKEVKLELVAKETHKENRGLELLKNGDYRQFAKTMGLDKPPSVADYFKKEVSIDDVFGEDSKEWLKSFVAENALKLEEQFLSFHGVKIFKNTISLAGDALLLDGCPIKEKVEAICKLPDLLKRYYSWKDYLKTVENFEFIPLAIANHTTSSQGVLRVSLHIKRTDFVPTSRLKPKGPALLEMHDCGLDAFFSPYCRYAGYEKYPSRSLLSESTVPALSEMTINYEKLINQQFDDLFCYEIESTPEEIIVKLEFCSVNAGEEHCFPTYLVLNDNTEAIYYEISGSLLPRKQTGKIQFENNFNH